MNVRMLDTPTRYHRNSPQPAGRRRLFLTVASALLLLIISVAAAVLVAAWWLGVPAVVGGLAARGVCSAVYLAGRAPDAVLREDLAPAHPLLRWVSLHLAPTEHSVTAQLGWFDARTARYLPPFGCVLDPTPALVSAAKDLARSGPTQSASPPPGPPPPTAVTWPPAPASVTAALAPIVTAAFTPGSAGDPNTRAVVIVVDGQLAGEHYGDGFDRDTPQLGWSMAKSVTGLLVHQRLADAGREAATTRVLDWVPAARRPDWLEAWAGDDRAALTVGDLLAMRERLDHVEAYAPWGAVPAMLWRTADVGRFAGSVARRADGPEFRYASAISNLLQATLRASFADDMAYWHYAADRLFRPLGLAGARFETDSTGTATGSSLMWATARDWARLAELMRQDGWDDGNHGNHGYQGDGGDRGDGGSHGRQLIAPGWLARASQPRPSTQPEAQRYAGHIWRIGAAGTLPCAAGDHLPSDALAMLGHWGQVAAILPARRAVVVRLGWAAPAEAFDRCAFLAAIDRTLAAVDHTGNTGNTDSTGGTGNTGSISGISGASASASTRPASGHPGDGPERR